MSKPCVLGKQNRATVEKESLKVGKLFQQQTPISVGKTITKYAKLNSTACHNGTIFFEISKSVFEGLRSFVMANS